MSQRPRLDSWKDIARHLGRDVRTVIRWEQERGLPVYRVPGGKFSRVFAYKDELDGWLARGNVINGAAAANGAPAPPAADDPLAETRWPNGIPSTAWRRAAIGTSIALVIVVAFGVSRTWMRAATPLQDLAVRGSELAARDTSGRTRWTYRNEDGGIVPGGDRWTHIGDLDGDGKDDVVAALGVQHQASNEFGAELLRFSADGGVQWRVTPADRLTYRDRAYGPPWGSGSLEVVRSQRDTRLAWLVHHYTWWPALLITLDARGERLGTFANGGWMQSVASASDGRTLFVSGISNSRNAFFLAALDGERPTGRSPEPPGSEMECVQCPEGDPLRYFIFPRTDVSREQPFVPRGPTLLMEPDGMLLVHTIQSGDPNFAAVIYDIAPDLTIRAARFSDSFWEWHRRLENQGLLHHSSDACPERRGLDVQDWTRATGWRTRTIAVK
jgi:hypothetical protein